MKISYKDSGVNISEGNRAVELMKAKVKETYTKGVVGDIGLFSGGFSLKDFMHFEEPTLLASTDGVGTKLIIAQQMDIHNTVGIDLVAMCVNDLICQGAKPLFFLDYIATGKVDAVKIADIVGGIAAGCKETGCALIGGETAEMPGLYSEEEYDLGGFSVGIVDRKKIIDGRDIKQGDKIIGLKSSGLHSNGYSLARKIFFEHMNLTCEQKLDGMSDSIGKILLKPTKLYVNTIMSLIEEYDLKGIANITGGGLIENVPRILPEDLNAKINKNAWDYPEVFLKIKELDIVEEKELYTSFNMGIGMVIIVSEEKAQEICEYINNNLQDEAFIIGEITLGEKICQLVD